MEERKGQMEMGFAAEMPKEITVAQLEGLCGEISALRADISKVSNEKKRLDDELARKEGFLMDCLRACGKNNYHSQYGTATITHRTSVKTPKTPMDREAFFDYLKAKGIFDDMISVNSQTLTSFYRQELEAARERGEGMEFSMPGINEVTVREEISFLRK